MNKVTKTSGDQAYADPFLGPVDHTAHLKVDVSALTIDGASGSQVDADGYLKPGVPFKLVGGLGVPLAGTAGEYVYGVVVAPVKIVDENPTNATLGANTSDPFVAVATIAQVQRDIAEDNLGRAYSANELAAFAAAGSHISLTTT